MISSDYPSPVTVNGYSCRNCSDVARAKRNIDPANPSAGPFGADDPHKAKGRKHLFDMDGTTATATATPSAYSRKGTGTAPAIGGRVDISG